MQHFGPVWDRKGVRIRIFLSVFLVLESSNFRGHCPVSCTLSILSQPTEHPPHELSTELSQQPLRSTHIRPVTRLLVQ